jgi:paraquat-inducible protein B
MNDHLHPDGLPQANVVRGKRVRISVVWIIPILAAVVALGIAIQRIRNEGPTVTIVFGHAAGIEAGKTFIKYKDVTIGLVTAVQLSEDYTQVLVTARIAKNAAGLMAADAKFWVVQPRVSLSGISGLNTLLSGQYIGFMAGKSLEPGRHFVALEVAPIITDQAGRQFTLKASSLGSVAVGAPIYYRSLSVGEVTAYSLAADGKSIDMKVFVYAPYDRYVTSETRFWNASGIDVSAGADGVNIRSESLIAVLAGGLAFDVPEFLPAGPQVPAPANREFTLYKNQAAAMTQPDAIERRFVLYFNQSLRGLSVGAPVTLFGLTVGSVTEVGLTFDRRTDLFRPRVLVTFYPERLTARLSAQDQEAMGKGFSGMTVAERARTLRELVEVRGLRAQLQSGSLITGETYVAFDYFPGAPKARIDWSRDPLELPVAPGGLATMEAKLTSILTKLDGLPLDSMGRNTQDLLIRLNQTLKDTDTMIDHVDAQLLPEGTTTIAELHRAIANADRSFFGEGAGTAQDLHASLQELTGAARSIRVLVEYLETHPEALVRGKKQENP